MAEKATKLYEDIAARMIAQIHEGILRPGDRLPPERALAEEYGVSRTAIREALRSAGANELALPLLAQAVQTTESDWDGTALRETADVLTPVLEQYGAFFSHPIPIPTDPVSPPLDGSALSREDIRIMSAEEINRNWSQVSSALMYNN